MINTDTGHIFTVPDGLQVHVAGWRQNVERVVLRAPDFKHAFTTNEPRKIFHHATAWCSGASKRPELVTVQLAVQRRPAWAQALPLLHEESSESLRKFVTPVLAEPHSYVEIALHASPRSTSLSIYGPSEADVVQESVVREIAFEGLESVVLIFQVQEQERYR